MVYSVDLDGIEVGETCLSNVDGEVGTLSYRGQPIETLVDKPFWSVVWLLLLGSEPSAQEQASLGEFMAANSPLNEYELSLLRALPKELHPMLMLQGMVPLLKLHSKTRLVGLPDAAIDGLLIAAKLPSLIAAWRRLELGEEPQAASSDLDFHRNFLTQFHGREPSSEQVKVLDVTQILQMEHSFNAGTFAGRVCASTQAPIQSSISASIGTLFGVLHGGADQAALEMAKHIGAPEKAAAYVAECLAAKVKIMGMGHREYRVLDPRAKVLKPMAKLLCSEGEPQRLFATLQAVEDACQDEFSRKGKDIRANVEFYKGAVFHQLGVPAHYFTALFAMARVYGYVAHYLEFNQSPRLIRPRARYIGQ